jgi:hypothetical protein
MSEQATASTVRRPSAEYRQEHREKGQHPLRTRSQIEFYIVLLGASAVFLIIEHFTHMEFMLHMAAIPLEILVAVFIIQRFLDRRESERKRRQLMFIKSYLFRSDMSHLFMSNFDALKSPPVTMSRIKNSTLGELRRMRQESNTVEYKSLEDMEPVIMQYVSTQHIWQNFMERAITYDFEEIFHDMIYILHFVHDVKAFQEKHPGKLFVHEAQGRELLMRKARKVLGDGIRVFLDYAIELKEKQPEMFHEIISEYELLSQEVEP